MEYDGIFKTLGPFGRYQLGVYMLSVFLAFGAVFNNMGIVFLAAVPIHRCFVPGLDKLNLSEEVLLNVSIPLEQKNGEMVYSQCYMYNRNYTGWSQNDVMQDLVTNINKSELPLQPCESWVYDKSIYLSSIVTKWDLVCNKRWLQATATSIYMAGLMVGLLVFGNISDFFGRRIASIGSMIMMVAIALGVPFSPNYVVFVVLRFFLAVATMSSVTVLYVLVMEVVGPTMRTHVSASLGYCWVVGFVAAGGIAYFLRDFFSLQLTFSCCQILYLAYIFLVPESSRWLYAKGKNKEAKKSIERMASINKKPVPELLKFKENQHQATVVDLFRTPRLRLRTINIYFNWFVNSLLYYGLSLYSVNFGTNPYLSFCISGLVELPGYVFTHLGLLYISRRWFLGSSLIAAGAVLLATVVIPKDMTTLIMVFAMAGKLFVSASFGTVYIFSIEIYPTIARNIGISTSSMCARIGGVVAPYIGQLGYISQLIPMITFGVVSILAGLLAFLLPETRNTSLPETIQDAEHFGRKLQKTHKTQDNHYDEEVQMIEINKH